MKGSTNCGNLSSRMRELGVSLENMEKMESITKMTYNTLFMIQNTLFVDQMTQNTFILRHFWRRLTKTIIYTLGLG